MKNPLFFLICGLSLFKVEGQLIKINILRIFKIMNEAFPVHDILKKCAANQPIGRHDPNGRDVDFTGAIQHNR